MIKPDKHTNLDISILSISAFILTTINRRKVIGYDQMLKKTIKQFDEGSKEIYPYALNFLFLLGKLDYDAQKDTFSSI